MTGHMIVDDTDGETNDARLAWVVDANAADVQILLDTVRLPDDNPAFVKHTTALVQKVKPPARLGFLATVCVGASISNIVELLGAAGETRVLALWAADCAERVLPIFEARLPGDSRPRAAIAAAHSASSVGSEGSAASAAAFAAAFAAHAASAASAAFAAHAAHAARTARAASAAASATRAAAHAASAARAASAAAHATRAAAHAASAARAAHAASAAHATHAARAAGDAARAAGDAARAAGDATRVAGDAARAGDEALWQNQRLHRYLQGEKS